MAKDFFYWRDEAFKKLKEACICCGEQKRAFLTIDHINGNGKKHRDSLGGYQPFYRWIVETANVKETVRIMCMNCNWATRYKDPCPHKEQKQLERKMRMKMRKSQSHQVSECIEIPPGMIMARHVGMLRGSEFDIKNDAINQQTIPEQTNERSNAEVLNN